MRHEFHPEALAEYEAAALYYAERDPAVGQRFIAAIEDAIDRILDSPTRWRVLDEDVRRCLTRAQSPGPQSRSERCSSNEGCHRDEGSFRLGSLVVVGKRDGDFVFVDRRRIELVENEWAKQPYH